MTSLTVTLNPVLSLTHEQFFQLCQHNPDLRFERTANGDLIVMSPTGSETGNRNAGLVAQLWVWNEQAQTGKVFDSSTGFHLPNGSDRSPDAAWVVNERWQALTPDQQKGFAPICPDFVVELMSPSDSLQQLQQKLAEYQENGARLGWLINRQDRQVEIYRQKQSVEVLENPNILLGETVLPSFVLNLDSIW